MDARSAYEPRTGRTALEPGGEIAWLDFGPPWRQPDVVFLHANGFNARAYRSILAPLAPSLRILALDQRGHGASTLRTDRPRASWDDLKVDLLAFLRAMGLTRVALAGHSMGATASLLAAAEAPGAVRALALFDPVIRPFEAGAGAGAEGANGASFVEGALRRRRTFPSRADAVEAYRGRGAFRTWTDEMLEDYVAGGFHDRPDGEVELACTPEWETSNYVNQAHDAWGALERVRCPVRILLADHQSPGRLEGRIDQLRASGRFRIETIAGTTHFLPMERPDLVRAAILEAAAAP